MLQQHKDRVIQIHSKFLTLSPLVGQRRFLITPTRTAPFQAHIRQVSSDAMNLLEKKTLEKQCFL